MGIRLAVLMIVAAAPAAVAFSPVLASAAPGSITPFAQQELTVSELTSFTSPSGNIGCYIDVDSVRCDIAERDWAPPPKPASCPDVTGFGQGITLSAGRAATFVCAGDTALGAGDPLAYGNTITAGSIECTSLPSGIQCWDFVHGGEFTIAREAYEIA